MEAMHELRDQAHDTILEIHVASEGGQAVVALRGELDISNVLRFDLIVHDLAAATGHLTIDLVGLTFMDSSGIHALLRATHRAELERWGLSIRNASPAVLRIIEVSGLIGFLPLI